MSFALLVSCGEDIPGMLPAGRWSRREEGGREGSPARLRGDRNATADPQEQPGLLTALPVWGHPSPAPLPPSGSQYSQCKLGRGGGGMQRVPHSLDPRRGWQAKAVPFFGMFSSLLLGNSPTHPHQHQKGINWFIELFAAGCRSRPCRAGDGPARLPPGLPGASSP